MSLSEPLFSISGVLWVFFVAQVSTNDLLKYKLRLGLRLLHSLRLIWFNLRFLIVIYCVAFASLYRIYQ